MASSADIREIFDHIVSRILALVDQQIDGLQKKIGGPPKVSRIYTFCPNEECQLETNELSCRVQFVILVGGFGKCKYLYERLAASLDGDSEVMQPADPGP